MASELREASPPLLLTFPCVPCVAPAVPCVPLQSKKSLPRGRLSNRRSGADQDIGEERVRRSVARFGWTAPSETKLPGNVKVLRGDLLSDEWHAAPELRDVTHVLHLAASTSFGNHPGISRTNVGGALSVAKAMRGRRVERYIHTGTATICGASRMPMR